MLYTIILCAKNLCNLIIQQGQIKVCSERGGGGGGEGGVPWSSQSGLFVLKHMVVLFTE